MDLRFKHLLGFAANHSANAFKILGNSMQAEGRGGDHHGTDTILRLDSPGPGSSIPSYVSSSKGTKRKWDLIDGCKAKDTDEESSMDIELNFSLHLGSDKVQSMKKPVNSNLKTLELQPKFDLELSLSTGPCESDITSVNLNPSPLQLNMEMPFAFNGTQNTDEGSTSCSWKSGIVLPSSNTGTSFLLNQASEQFDHSPIVVDLSSSRPKSSGTCTSGLTQQQQPLPRHSNSKTCQVEGCGKGARGASGRCISHGGGRRCQKPGCHKGAEGRTVYCKAHGGGRRCEFLGCTKSAEGRTDFCIAHGGGRRCSHEICTKSVHGGTNFCVAHGGGKRCAVPGCTKSARGRTDHCVRHGGGKRCKFEGCGKSAQGSTDFCKAHGGGKRCSWGHPGSEYGIEQDGPCNSFARGKTGLCALHSGLVHDKRVHGGFSLGSVVQDPHSSKPDELKQVLVDKNMDIDMMKMGSSLGNAATCSDFKQYEAAATGHVSSREGGHLPMSVAVPEGRVHGGSLMAMLTGGSSRGSCSGRDLVSEPCESIKGYPVPQSWI
uniref:WRKY transcription factor 19 n=1 Tax=Cajanus cajan TaxID=3821 RepID=A0A151SV36_CAJCA|nr:putative WRKY transcription factor 19 [Cajanus cajan]